MRVCRGPLGPFSNYLAFLFYFFFFISFWMPKRAKTIVASLSAELFKNPRQIHTLNRIHQRRSLSTINARTVLNKKFINSPQHIMTNEPLIINAYGDPYQQNGSQKWASSLATAQQPVIINGGHQHTPHQKHAHTPSSIHHKDKAAIMGMSTQLRGPNAKTFRYHSTLRFEN